MIESGLVIGIALLFTLGKMSWPWKLRVLSNPLIVDAIVFIGLCLLHWGTFSGVMAATVGAFIVSMVLSLGRYLFGYMDGKRYVRGYMDIGGLLHA